jgi:hypothetical protein
MDIVRRWPGGYYAGRGQAVGHCPKGAIEEEVYAVCVTFCSLRAITLTEMKRSDSIKREELAVTGVTQAAYIFALQTERESDEAEQREN